MIKKILTKTIKRIEHFIGPYHEIKSNCEIGQGTRINGKITIKGSSRCNIGKYCALGDNIKIITVNHSMEFANLQGWLQRQINGDSLRSSKGDVNIGHNVWIGDNAIILSGVTIGDGAVIGAGAIVTKHVKPFSIVCGNPAKEIRMRFHDNTIKQLLDICWWEWDENKILRNKDFFSENLRKLPPNYNLNDLLVE